MFASSVFNKRIYFWWRAIVRPWSNPQAGRLPLLGCLWLNIQYTLSYPSYLKASPQAGGPPNVGYLRMHVQYIRRYLPYLETSSLNRDLLSSWETVRFSKPLLYGVGLPNKIHCSLHKENNNELWNKWNISIHTSQSFNRPISLNKNYTMHTVYDTNPLQCD